MIQLLKYCTFCLVAVLLFSSCGTNLSITKRRYNKGFHIDHVKDQTIAPFKSSRAIKETTTVAGVMSTGKTVKNEAPPINTSVSDPEKQYYPIHVEQSTDPLSQGKSETTMTEKTRSIRFHTLGASTDHEHGLSFFWVVILILLILWVLGLLSGGFGLGGLINLLWIIALVLLILWLLRVV